VIATRPAVEAAFYEERHAVVGDSRLDRYLPLYIAAANLVPEGANVVELGCGSGRFAELLLGHVRLSSYLGLDFAPALIEEAMERAAAPLFAVADLRTDPIPLASVYVSLEVLEHLDDDLGLLQRLPSRSLVILSVPSFDSASHVRTFPEPGSARARYEPFLRIREEQRIDLPNGAFFHLLAGRVRAKADMP